MLGPTPPSPRPSYAALLRVPAFGRVVVGTLLARLGGQMWEIVLVLFVLQRYRSPSLAGLTVLLSIVPGLALSPIAGALLDRQGRVRLMIFDYTVTAALTATLVALSLGHRLPPPLLLAMVTVLGVSNILSITGARSLFPLMLPQDLWDRANGLDTSLYAVTAIIGPAIAGVVVARFGPEMGLLVTASVAAMAAVSLVGVHDPVARAVSGGSLIGDSWAGLVYVLRHASLRGLAIALFLSNLGFGVIPVGIPVLVLLHLHGNAATVGQIFAAFGLAGLAAGLLIGRVKTDGRERLLIACCIAVQVPAIAVLAFVQQLPVVFGVALLGGAASSIINVGIFAIRQRRTAPSWFGRAFAVSMSFNFAGQPIGSALSGPLLERSIALPFLLGAAINVVAAIATMVLIPKHHRSAGP
ncbi:MAG TPA: MFS transporter [Candidatus Dormibacteraeota bacterium]|nr:MFS transporter [Candidatus Dormibacteraeota bacterium]